jgi:hypothetical protein
VLGAGQLVQLLRFLGVAVRAALAVALFLAFPAQAADWGVHQLFAMLAKDRPGRATFQEKKFMALLDRPVESSGELAFTPPHTMEKRTLAPRAELVRVDRERVTLERGGKRHSIGLRENPSIAVLVESIRATLAGDLEGLVRNYSVGLEGAPKRWLLTLRPLDTASQQIVERIDISGAESRVTTVEIRQADGDRSVMTVMPVPR